MYVRKVFVMLDSFLNSLQELNTITIVTRIVLAILIGGIVGVEREIDSKVAGLRTHMLVSLGSAVVMITNQYMYEFFPDANVDIARLGAQVISGIGFLGAGTILVTSNNQVSGLTTAAGLWTTAILGLSAGIGFYKLSIIGTLSVMFVTIFLKPFKQKLSEKVEETHFSLAVYSVDGVREFIKYSHQNEAHLSNFKIDEESIYRGTEKGTSFHVTVRLNGNIHRKEFITGLRKVSGIKVVNLI